MHDLTCILDAFLRYAITGKRTEFISDFMMLNGMSHHKSPEEILSELYDLIWSNLHANHVCYSLRTLVAYHGSLLERYPSRSSTVISEHLDFTFTMANALADALSMTQPFLR